VSHASIAGTHHTILSTLQHSLPHNSDLIEILPACAPIILSALDLTQADVNLDACISAMHIVKEGFGALIGASSSVAHTDQSTLVWRLVLCACASNESHVHSMASAILNEWLQSSSVPQPGQESSFPARALDFLRQRALPIAVVRGSVEAATAALQHQLRESEVNTAFAATQHINPARARSLCAALASMSFA
jgi:hypothetical protein